MSSSPPPEDPLEPPPLSPDYGEEEEEGETNDSNTASFKGFSSSIAHLFVNPSDIRADACSLVCCGILQSDRDRYLLTGIRPPTWTRRFLLHLVLPVTLFSVACYAAIHIRHIYMNQLLSTLLISMLFMYLIVQACCKFRWKKVLVRKEILWRKFQIRHPDQAATMEPPDEDDDHLPDTQMYLQGQSIRDLNCAHGICGCYSQDIPKHKDDVQEPKDLCSCLWSSLMKACCGRCCGCYWQCCGMCALAQEARELERMVPANQRRIDYVTMQPSLLYYREILERRANQDEKFDQHIFSQLSIQLAQLWVIVVVAFMGLCLWLRLHWGHTIIFCGTFLHSAVFLYVVHWLHHKHDISADCVLKAFSSGFFLCTSMAVVWETIAGLLVRFFVDVYLSITGTDVAVDDGYDMPFLLPGGFAQASTHKEYLELYGRDHPFFYAVYLFIDAFLLAAFIEELIKYLGYQMITDHPDFWSENELECAIEAVVQEDTAHTGGDDEQLKQQISVEGMQTHAQRKTAKTRGDITTVAMVAVAIGFTCCENLVYVFIYNDNSLNVELTVLIARMLFPIHPICAAIQSIGVVRRDIEKDSKHLLGRIILPGILVHGVFDYALMMTDYFGRGSPSSTLIAAAMGVLIMVGSVAWLFHEGKLQRQRLKNLDQQTNVDQSRLL